MRKALTLCVLALFVALGLSSPASATNKVTICHAAGLAGTMHYVTITVGYPAVYGPAGHFYENGTPRAGHEQDYFGSCVLPPTTTTEVTPSTTTTTSPGPSTTSTSATSTPSTTQTSGPTSTVSTPSTVPGTAPPRPGSSPTPNSPTGELPHTGASLWLLFVGLACVGSGGLLLLRSRFDAMRGRE